MVARSTEKFNSNPERKQAVVLEKEPTVRLWMKPGSKQFKIWRAVST